MKGKINREANRLIDIRRLQRNLTRSKIQNKGNLAQKLSRLKSSPSFCQDRYKNAVEGDMKFSNAISSPFRQIAALSTLLQNGITAAPARPNRASLAVTQAAVCPFNFMRKRREN
jgi:hypothetical protein